MEERPQESPSFPVVRFLIVAGLWALLIGGFIGADCTRTGVDIGSARLEGGYTCEDAFGVPFLGNIPPSSTDPGQPDPMWMLLGYGAHAFFGGIVSVVSIGGWALQKLSP